MLRASALSCLSILSLLLVTPGSAGAAPPTSVTTFTVCEGPWTVAPLPPAASGREWQFVRRVVRLFELDPVGFTGLFDTGHMASLPSVWGLPPVVVRSLVAEDHLDMIGIAEVRASGSGCPPAVGVLVRGSHDVVFVLDTNLDVYGGNGGWPVLVSAGGLGPLTVALGGPDTTTRFMDYSDGSCTDAVVVLAAPRSTVQISAGGTTCVLQSSGNPIRKKEVPAYILDWMAMP